MQRRILLTVAGTLLATSTALASDCYFDVDRDGDWDTVDDTKWVNLYNAGSLRADFDADGALTFDDWIVYSFWRSQNACPCLADLNGDGVKDIADETLAFQNYTAGSPRFDLNFDGVTDITDLVTFYTLYNDPNC